MGVKRGIHRISPEQFFYVLMNGSAKRYVEISVF